MSPYRLSTNSLSVDLDLLWVMPIHGLLFPVHKSRCAVFCLQQQCCGASAETAPARVYLEECRVSTRLTHRGCLRPQHKISRGYLPSLTYSVHYLRDPGFKARNHRPTLQQSCVDAQLMSGSCTSPQDAHQDAQPSCERLWFIMRGCSAVDAPSPTCGYWCNRWRWRSSYGGR